MKLPSHLRKLRRFTVYSLAFYVLILVMFSPVPQIYAASTSLGNNPWFSDDSSQSNTRVETEIIIVDPITKKVIRPEEVGFDYDPVQGDSNPGSNFAVDDIIGVTHNDVLDLEYSQISNTITDGFTITEPTSYTSDDLKFGIQKIEAVQDYYQIENSTDYLVDQLSYYDNIQVAQGFEIKWDYAYFTGAKIYLDQVNLGPWGIYALDLLLVSAETSSPFEPNMSDILSSDINDPYNSANILPSSSIDNIHFYNFTDVVLLKGEYFIVANLSVVDTGDPGTYKHFAWHKKLGGDLGGNSFRKSYGSSSWTQIVNYDYNLIPQLLPSFSNGTAYKFTDPEAIDLRDNSNSVSSFSSSISTSGLHTITSNTSVQITLANSYTFKQTLSASSLFDVTNSTYWSYSATWNLTWSTSAVDISPYTNLDRNQLIYTPDDWHSSFTFYYNDTNTMPGSREVNGYELNLGSNDSAGNWLLITTSPNYLSNLELLDDITPSERFFLGYWVGGATDSTGYVGSKIVANTLVQGDGGGTPYNEITGSLNYTLYDINGNIIPLKSSLPANLIYTDTTSYSLSGITQVSAGFYTPEIHFDPSASGSDLPGFWTAAVMWQNGTEVGFYSQRIVVQTQTELVLEWEEEPSNDNWITTDITRKGLDSILVRGSYYNISEPYTIGTKNLIPSATVSYTVNNATWNKNDVFNDYAPDYNTSILIDANIDVGTYTVDFLGTGAFLENNSTSFTLTVFYELVLVPKYTNYQTNYTNNVSYYMNLYDVTASANLSLAPNDMTVTITNGTDFPLSSPVDYTFDNQTEQWVLNISTSTNNLYTGFYSVEISIYLNNYRASYSAAYVSDVYTFEITAPKTSIEKTGDATTIYVYHDAVFSFRYLDTNHSTALITASYSGSASESNIIVNINRVGDTYFVTVTNNNPSVSSFDIYIDIDLTNYEAVTSYQLGSLSVLTIETSLTDVLVPTEVYVGYVTSIVVYFEDTTHSEDINQIGGDGLFVIVTSNATMLITYVDTDFLGGGQYNVSFINNDYTMPGINITITIGRTGYESASMFFEIQVISINTDSQLVDSADQDITIYFGEGTIVEVLYWDDILGDNITTPDIFIDGNISVTFGDTFADNITTITINPIYSVGTFYLNITIIKPGYAPQMIQILITIEERVTDLIINAGDVNTTEYASEEIDLSFDFRDVVGGNISIDSALVSALFAQDNSSLEIDDYFNSITNTTFGDYYIVSFNVDPSVAVGTVYILEITFSKYGYQSQTIIIRITFPPARDYDIDIIVEGDIRQLETIEFVVLVENLTAEIMAEGSDAIIHVAPTPYSDSVNITYTFTYANGTIVTYWELVQLTPNGSGGFIATYEVYIPWHVTNISYFVTYAPGGTNQYVIVAQSSAENQTVVANPTFVALLTYFFREYTLYMIIGIVAIALIVIAIIIIQFTIVRPRKQRKKEGKRKYLDKISKILTSVLSLRKVIIVHTESGLPIYEWDLGGEITVDSSLVTGFLQAVAGMGSEISGGQTGAIKKLDYGQFVVSSASKDCICAYLFSTSEVSIDVETGLAGFVEWFEKRFKSVLHDWGGVTDEFTNNSRQIIDTLSEELFIWTLHPLSINTLKEKDVQKLNSFGQKIFNFIKDYKEVTISVALEYFNKTPLEETLSTLFNMIDEKYLLRMRLR